MNALEQAKEDFENRIQNIADKVRTDIIIPVCKEYGLEFVSGNGRAIFFLKDWEKYSTDDCRCPDAFEYDWELDDTLLAGKLTHALDLINQEVSYNSSLGNYISDVRKEHYNGA